MQHKFPIMVIGGLIALIGGSGCELPGNTSSIDAQGVVVPAGTNVSSTTIGPAGGTLTSTDGMATLTVPAGALSQQQTVSLIAQDVDDEDVPDELSGSEQRAYTIDSGGLSFDAPVQINVTVDSAETGLDNTVSVNLMCLVETDNAGGFIGLVAGQQQVVSGSSLSSSLVADIQPAADRFTTVHVAELTRSPITLDVEENVGTLSVDAAPVALELSVEGTNVLIDSVDFTATVNTPMTLNPLTGSLTSNNPTSNSPRYRGETDQDCLSVGTGSYSIDFDIAVRPDPNNSRSPFPVEGVTKRLRYLNTINCTDDSSSGGGGDGGGTAVSLREGLFSLPTASPEGIYFIGSVLGNLGGTPPGAEKAGAVRQEGAATSTGSVLVSYQGTQGSGIIDLTTGAVVFGGGDTSREPGPARFGLVPMSRPNPGPSTPAALFSFGERDTGPFGSGAFLTPYLPDERRFSDFGQISSGRFLDAVPSGGGLVTDEVLLCVNGTSGSIEFDPAQQSYGTGSAAFDVGRACVSMVAATAGGPVLSVSITEGRFTDSRLYFTDRAGSATDVATLGVSARRIRHLGNIAAVSLFAEDALRIVIWDGQNAPSLVDSAIPVADGPVGIDLRDAGSGETEIVSTGFNDNQLAITRVDSAGAAISNRRFETPDGCQAPAHAIFIDNADDANDPYVVGSCFSSGGYFVSRLSRLTELLM